jgi:polysaccharide deacetylase 2 family uncharacterized protein YibQ
VSRRRYRSDWSGHRRPMREERIRRGGARLRLRLRLDEVTWRRVAQIAGGALGVAALVFVLGQLLKGGPAGGPEGPAGLPEAEQAAWSARLEPALRTAATGSGLREEWIVPVPADAPEGDSLLTVIEFRVPGDVRLEVLNLALSRAVREQGGEVTRGIERSDTRVELEVAWRSRPTHRLILQRYSRYRRVTGRVAVIIDDWGRADESLLRAFADLPAPWTASVIPGQPRTAENVQGLTARRIPLMIHLPMQPENGEAWDLGTDAVYVDTPAERMTELLTEALRQIPGAHGLNNHMGSQATADSGTMRTFMRELQEHDLFFLDSVTTAASTAAEQADRAGVRWARRDLFIDPEDDPAVIRTQLGLALQRAAERGSVILIGHPRPLTLEALQRWIPQVRDRGLEFVTVDRLLQGGRER